MIVDLKIFKSHTWRTRTNTECSYRAEYSES